MAEKIRVTLPDGKSHEVARGTTPLALLRQIDPLLAERALVARCLPAGQAGDGELWDLNRPLEADTQLAFLTAEEREALDVFRHSSAHLLAAAVLELYPEVKLGVGPPTENGFFYEFLRAEPFTPEDLARIEEKMGELRDADLPYERKMMSREEGLRYYAGHNQDFKCELVREKASGNDFSVYVLGKFVDFCRGPHIPSAGRIKAFKLLNVSGAYWKGIEGNPQMQRIYGTSFPTQEELDAYLHQLEEARQRDHRKLGRELDLFSIQEKAGSGLIFWHPKGGAVRTVMEDWLRAEYLRRGYQLVYTPHVMRLDMWKTSGHLDWFTENMFAPIEVEKTRYQLKPMNCPGHILIYQSQRRSYRQLPVRLAELGTVYRYERSGVVQGLLRVRGFTVDDAHIFCTPAQAEEEILGCMDFALETLRVFGFDRFEVNLSGGDPADRGHFAGTAEGWEQAERVLAHALESRKVSFTYKRGEAAFYGPKIDIRLIDAIGRPWQLSTIQFDFNLPERFELKYVGEDGQLHQPVMVHRALWGSVERFFGILIEHYAGAFPFWLAPVQVVILPISEKVHAYAAQVAAKLRAAPMASGPAGLRVELDDRNESLNYRIRDAQLHKVPFMLVAGKREEQAGTVSVRARAEGDLGAQTLDAFLARCADLLRTRAPKP
ncbi:MAG: threonine--tRNA ligase [Terriglobia bacterium]